MPRYQTCTPTCLSTMTFGLLSSCGTKSGGVSTMRSSAPVSSSVSRAWPSTIDHAIDLHRVLPVPGVLLQHHALAAVPRHELEGSGADGGQRVVHPELAHRRRAHDRRRARGEHGQERGARLLEDEFHGLRIHGLDGLDVAEEVIREGILAELVERMLRDDLALDRELHRLGVEGGAVVEADALAQL